MFLCIYVIIDVVHAQVVCLTALDHATNAGHAKIVAFLTLKGAVSASVHTADQSA